jgi:hypothetical protein
MVRAILDGRKTQTRRIMKIQPDGRGTRCTNVHFEDWHGRKLKCPYGWVGDILWVRETWSKTDSGKYIYAATNNGFNPVWKPSIFMPKDACRLRLEITNVRIEKLCDISEEDCAAEGVEWGLHFILNRPRFKDYSNPNNPWFNNPRSSYISLWRKIHGKNSWEQNPWVWVIEFRKL